MNSVTLDPGMERLLDLLADRAVQGLSPAESQELQALLATYPEVDADGLDLAAAALDVALIGSSCAAMPADLSARVAAAAAPRGDARPAAELRANAREMARRPEVIARVGPLWKLGWVAAAACAALAAAAWWPGVRAGADAPAQLADIETLPDVVRTAWQPGNDPKASGVAGEVVWCPSRQVGFMVFNGLPRNNPGVEQYQLWIFDSERDEAAPVHGGVFDACPDASGRCVVRFEPRLGVKDVTLFAVTVERPGGVWVSKRERIPVLASVKKT